MARWKNINGVLQKIAGSVRIDQVLNKLSRNAISNKAVSEKFEEVEGQLIGSIVRNGTTFTAKDLEGNTLFTFTQQDNNTTTGTSYNAGACPDNTTFATNGSVARAYNALNKISYGVYPTGTNSGSNQVVSNHTCRIIWTNDGYLEIWIDVTCVFRVKGHTTITY